MYKIKSTTIIDHSKSKGLIHSMRGLVTVQVNLSINTSDFTIQFLPDASHNYNLNLSLQNPESKKFIEFCNKLNIDPDYLANDIKEKLNLQSQWQGYVKNI